jgi:flavin reductase (DIM6/NTAB) family NADH-FMN oxidoreductase RutF
MERRIAEKAQRYFITGVSLITSLGPSGKNVMAAEWTMQISFEPTLIAVFIHEGSSTLENIKKTKEFGVNVASEEQTTAVSIAGGYSRKELDKMSIQNSFQIIKPKKIKPPLIAGSIIHAECKLVTTKRFGDHTMVVGKVVSMRYDETKKPLVYHKNRYFRIGHMIEPVRHKIEVNQKIFNLFTNKAGGKFILKCVGALARSGNKILVLNNLREKSACVIPHVASQRGKDQKKTLEIYLKKINADMILKPNPSLKRLILKKGKKIQRVNFIVYPGVLKNKFSNLRWKSIKNNSLLQALAK